MGLFRFPPHPPPYPVLPFNVRTKAAFGGYLTLHLGWTEEAGAGGRREKKRKDTNLVHLIKNYTVCISLPFNPNRFYCSPFAQQ